MVFRKIWQMLFAVNLVIIITLGSSAAKGVRTDLSKIEMRADYHSVSAGDDFHIIIELSPDQGWHGYWENPGDAGLKLEMDWEVQEGVEIGDLQFTTPELIPFEEIISYGYDGKVTIIADAHYTGITNLEQLQISGRAFWLLCSDALCVPQEAKIGFSLPIGQTIINKDIASLVETAKADMPIQVDWNSNFSTDGQNFTVMVEIPEEYTVIESAYLFPHTEGMMENIYYQDLSFINGKIIGRFKNAYNYEDNQTFKFLLKFKTGSSEEKSFLLSAKKTNEPITTFGDALKLEQAGSIIEFEFISALLFAFIGGLFLNLMPCVFPILSLKVLKVVELLGKNKREARISGLIYSAGVIVSFGMIGLTVNILSLGWGFHMQMPIVNFSLGLLMVLIGLNLLGVFDFGGPLSGLGQGLVRFEGDKPENRRATFFTGVLAVVVATPCTAPFMASALGYAFVNAGLSGFFIFIALGLGLAFPYLLLCYMPSLRSVLPRPGLWMETMRNILGFPMLATALWLFWILGSQAGVNAMAVALIASLFLTISLWAKPKQSLYWKTLSAACLLAVIYSGYFISNIEVEKRLISVESDNFNAIPYSSEDLKKLIDNKKPVFVYFTADWCVTCKLNERVTLSKPLVQEAFRESDVTVMVGDWTNQNPDITKTIQGYGRIGVPLYLYFSSGSDIRNPEILPQLLTPSLVINIL